MRNIYKILFRKSEQKRRLGIFRRRWEDNIRMNLGVIVWDDVDTIHLIHDRDKWRALANWVLKLQVPYKIGNLFD
jgi:hypothetical protein